MLGTVVWRLARLIISAVVICSLISAATSGAYAASFGLQLQSNAGPSGSVERVRFISPDPWDPIVPGVGTNRYAYAENDPINKSDPSGHVVPLALGIAAVVGALLGSTTEANAPGPGDPIQTTPNGEMLGNMALGASAGMSLGRMAAAPLRGASGVIGDPDVSSFDPQDMRFSQKSVSYTKADPDAMDYGEIVESMKKDGWVGKPVDAVRMEDGQVTTIDNTRVTAARETGVRVRARVHNFDEAIPPDQAARFKGNPDTWGDAVKSRIDGQGSRWSNENPNGSYTTPEVKGAPQ
jgi:hypothetical protein